MIAVPIFGGVVSRGAAAPGGMGNPGACANAGRQDHATRSALATEPAIACRVIRTSLAGSYFTVNGLVRAEQAPPLRGRNQRRPTKRTLSSQSRSAAARSFAEAVGLTCRFLT